MLVEALEAKVAKGELSFDARQHAAAERLDRLAAELAAMSARAPLRQRSWLGRLVSGQSEAPPDAAARGLYIHGAVGRGKSMLMDLFFQAVPLIAKRRVHFHAFMLEIQSRLNALRRDGDVADPLRRLAADIAGQTGLLCFDEFHVVDIADAMILGRLFEGLWDQGIVIVATSNWPPHRLYENGLNRDRFLPFIDELTRRQDVLALDGPIDYRLTRLADLPVYLSPADAAADAALERIFATLAEGRPGEPEAIEVGSRLLPVPRAAGGVAWFEFMDLCERALGAADYLALTRHYHSVILQGVPRLGPGHRNEARRFVTLIDAFYECRVMLFLTAEAPPDQLYPVGDGSFEFQRTVSRLAEMQSRGYLEQCRDRRPERLPAAFTTFALTTDI